MVRGKAVICGVGEERRDVLHHKGARVVEECAANLGEDKSGDPSDEAIDGYSQLSRARQSQPINEHAKPYEIEKILRAENNEYSNHSHSIANRD